jgi:hypothetical protein
MAVVVFSVQAVFIGDMGFTKAEHHGVHDPV